ncbi:hypothetical protein [Nocardioides sp. HB32]
MGVRRSSTVAVAGLLALPVLMVGCSSGEPDRPAPVARATGLPHGSLDQHDYDAAVAAATDALGADDTISRATATVQTGHVGASNTGHPCRSERRLEVALVGDFPHIVTTGTVAGGDTTVREVDLTVDPQSGETCVISVRTAAARPPAGAAVLDLG